MWCKHQLGELARNEPALRARGVSLLAISVDAPADSRNLAADYGITYPLLSDTGGTVSRAYVGVEETDNSVPGVVVIRRDGRIAYRQIGAAADDRLGAADVLAIVDRTLGTTGTGIRGGYGALQRIQLRLDGGGGALHTADGWRGTATGTLALFVPLGRYAIAGPWLAGEPRESQLDVDAAVGARLPMWTNTAALQLIAFGGWTAAGSTQTNAGARAGFWAALTPRWSLHLEAGATLHGLTADDRVTELVATFGIARLFER